MSWTFFIPLFVLGGLLVLLGVFVLLGRIAGGRYLRPVMSVLLRTPGIGKLLNKASRAALEKQNPELASAIRKLERLGANRDPKRAQAALSQLSAAERRAYLEAAGEEEVASAAVNRAQRRQLSRARKGR
jgi:hypothetical protein